MKARTKAKQVEVMTNCVKQLIEINKEYHSQILDLKEELQKKDAEIKNVMESSGVLAKKLLDSSFSIGDLKSKLKKMEIELEKERKEKHEVHLKMPIIHGNELMFGDVIYKKKRRIQCGGHKSAQMQSEEKNERGDEKCFLLNVMHRM